MKFSEIDQSSWEGLRPYLDTCLLPVTGLTGTEQPWEATQELEYLRDVLDCAETPFKGRIVTYPAFHFDGQGGGAESVNTVCRKLKEAGFRFVIVMTGHPAVAEIAYSNADLVLCPEMPNEMVMSGDEFRERVYRDIQALWASGAAPKMDKE